MRHRATAKHLLAAGGLLALCLACGAQPPDEETEAPASPVTAAAGSDITDAQLAQVRALACPGNAFACEALGRFEAASGPPPATTVAYSLIGRAFSTFNAWRGEEVDWFVARPGEQMSFGDVIAENEQEQAQTREVLATLTAGGTVDPAHPLAGFVRSLATGGQAAHPTELRGRSRHYRQDEMNADVFIRQGAGEILVVKTNGTGAVIGVFRQG
ncbi:MAG: hypothetical protein H6719_12475 [Sandaracinaceae bacterium]|nr:hypothetical protein [Sandaracinaceae bacterium]